MSLPTTIYLEPGCPKCGWEPVDPQWCEDNVWDGERCEECGEELPYHVPYVLQTEAAVVMPPSQDVTPLSRSIALSLEAVARMLWRGQLQGEGIKLEGLMFGSYESGIREMTLWLDGDEDARESLTTTLKALAVKNES